MQADAHTHSLTYYYRVTRKQRLAVKCQRAVSESLRAFSEHDNMNSNFLDNFTRRSRCKNNYCSEDLHHFPVQPSLSVCNGGSETSHSRRDGGKKSERWVGGRRKARKREKIDDSRANAGTLILKKKAFLLKQLIRKDFSWRWIITTGSLEKDVSWTKDQSVLWYCLVSARWPEGAKNSYDQGLK